MKIIHYNNSSVTKLKVNKHYSICFNKTETYNVYCTRGEMEIFLQYYSENKLSCQVKERADLPLCLYGYFIIQKSFSKTVGLPLKIIVEIFNDEDVDTDIFEPTQTF